MLNKEEDELVEYGLDEEAYEEDEFENLETSEEGEFEDLETSEEDDFEDEIENSEEALKTSKEVENSGLEPDEKAIKRAAAKGGALKEIGSFVLYIAAAVLITFLILHFVGQRTVVNGPSMMNTLKNGDNIILDKISYRFHEPERFDVIVFPVANEEKNYIKRVIGLPGEAVQIVQGFIHITTVDGETRELEESYGSEVMRDPETGEPLTTSKYTLEEGEYYVLGDNRNNSIDSRKIGAVKRENIIGRAWVRIYPFEAFGKIK